MFDTKKIGEKIAQFRLRKNITQMELAEEMSVSFQAVSSWERGSTMPDISRLPQLCQILGISIDQLLDDSPYLPTIHQLRDKDSEADQPISAQHLIELEPVIKPKELSNILHQNRESLCLENFSQLLQLIPFLSSEDAENLVRSHQSLISSLNDFAMIAPILPSELVAEIVDKLPQEALSINTFLLLAPVLDPNRIQYLLEQNPDILESTEAISQLAPFLPRDYLNQLLSQNQFSFSQEELVMLAPFADQTVLEHLIQENLSTIPSIDYLIELAPFLSSQSLQLLMQKFFSQK
ncbi:MAG: helix-turn-helix transcriptional regulator [Negativibacillus sp.]